jgi:hypothetical protein
MAQASKNSLGLGDDGDEIYFVEEIESAFGIQFRNEEMERCGTMGDLYDALCRHLQPVERGSFPCLSASAFRQVRKAIGETKTGAPIRPDTRIADLVGEERFEKWWYALERRCDLDLPPLWGGDWKLLLGLAAFGLVVLATVILALGNAGPWLWLLYGFAAFAMAVAVWAPYKASTSCETVGDLARAVGALNAGTLSQVHSAIRTHEAWSSFVRIAREFTRHGGPIDRETVLIG